jgi:hypothetical protein
MADDEVSKELASLARVQTYDTTALPRRDDLGRELSFEEAVPLADRAVQLFQLVPLDLLPHVPKSIRQQVRQSADQFFNILDQMQKFSAQQSSATEIRLSLINQLRANRVLAEVRKVAAEQGVGFQATYFKSEADNHDLIAVQWRTYTIVAGAALGIFAVAAMFLHKWDVLHPADATEAVQFSLAKLGLFAVLGFALILCSKTFLAHTHNAIVNRHRQNALLTFQALVNAAKEESKKDIILTHASACMFSPQETGFTKHSAEGTSNIIQLLTKAPGAEKAAG